MCIIGNVLDAVGELFRVGLEGACMIRPVARVSLPAVVYVDVLVPCCLEPAGDDKVDG